MAEAQRSNVNTWQDQEIKYIHELKTLILAYFVAIKKITTEEKDTAIVIAVKYGFHVYINTPGVTSSRVGAKNFNNCKIGGITLEKRVSSPRPQCNNSNYQQGRINDASGLTSTPLQVPDLPEPVSDSCLPTGGILPHLTDLLNVSDIPEPEFNLQITKYSYKLTSDCDKNFKLTVTEKDKQSKKLPANYDGMTDGCRISCNDITGTNNVTVDKQIEMGARQECVECMVICQERGLNTLNTRMNVLLIDNFKTYKDEIYIRAQMGPSKEMDQASKDRRKNREKIYTYFRYIVFSGYIFEVDYYDYYIYSIVGIVDYPSSSTNQWPWRNEDGIPIECPFNNVVQYEDLREGIPGNLDVFFTAFSNIVIHGQFRNIIPSLHDKRVLQLCLALAYSEVIRNFEAHEWNKMLLNHRYFFRPQSVDDLKTALQLHPMASDGTFQKRKTGHNGKTHAATKNIEPYEKFLYGIRNKQRRRER